MSRADAAGDDEPGGGAHVSLLCQRGAGELLAETLDGFRPVRGNTVSPLTALGVSKADSSRWQRVARVGEDTFGAYVDRVRDAGDELTTARGVT